MWECPTCSQKFDSKNQKHICKQNLSVIEKYISLQEVRVQSLLFLLHESLSTVLPDAQERISWGMPTYWNEHNIIHFAANKHHLGLYPGPKAIEYFADLLTEYKTTKGAIQFPYSKPLPLDLINEIAVWCYTSGNHH